MKIVLAGGSGFLGRSLIASYRHKYGENCEIVVLSRGAAALDGARVQEWDGRTLGDWGGELDGAAAVINLAGRSVNCRYNANNRRSILDSRIDSTRVLGSAICQLRRPPAVWINSSTATIYKHTFGEPHDESGVCEGTPEAKDEFSVEVARQWEKAFGECATPDTRKVVARTAMVFGNASGGVYETLRALVRCGLGGKMGDGRQFVSWIHAGDFFAAMEFFRENTVDGIYNVSAPRPLPNDEMCRVLRRVLGRRVGLPATRWMLEVGALLMRTETELIIKSRRVIPARLLAEGFEFQFEDLESALRDLEGR